MTTLGLGGLANSLMREPGMQRVVVLTSRVTGNPALSRFDLVLPDLLTAVQYEDPSRLRDEVTGLGLNGTIDLVVADPFHTYSSSWACLDVALDLLRDGGVLAVHDCLPPPNWTSPEQQLRLWCGVTFAAFRDLCTSRGVPWCTVDDDFGIGIAVPPRRGTAVPAVPDAWTRETHQSYLERYAADPFGFMRTVRADSAREAITRLREGEPMDALAATPIRNPSAWRQDAYLRLITWYSRNLGPVQAVVRPGSRLHSRLRRSLHRFGGYPVPMD